MLNEQTVTQGAWTSVRMHVPAGGAVALSLWNTAAATRALASFIQADWTQRGVNYSFGVMFHFIGSELGVHSSPAPSPSGSVDLHAAMASGAGCVYMMIPTSLETDVTLRAFEVANGPFFRGGFTVWGTKDSTLVNQMNGSSAYMGTERDFSGGSSFMISALAVNQTEIHDCSLALAVTSQLYGEFLTQGSTTRIGYDAPSGSQDGAEWYFFDGSEPGSYRFRIDEDNEPAPTLLAVADIADP